MKLLLSAALVLTFSTVSVAETKSGHEVTSAPKSETAQTQPVAAPKKTPKAISACEPVQGIASK